MDKQLLLLGIVLLSLPFLFLHAKNLKKQRTTWLIDVKALNMLILSKNKR